MLSINIKQGSQEWLDLRKSKIGASDAPVIMKSSPWKTPLQLYGEKTGSYQQNMTDKMKRGLDLEESARQLFCMKSGHAMEPKVLLDDYRIASLDGLSECGKYAVEIKCPGEKDHQMALYGQVPEKYIAQLQHQMLVANLDYMYYFSFDGLDGIIVTIDRDDKYIKNLISEEDKFYDCLINKTPPDPCEKDYIVRNDDLWKEYAEQWITINSKLKELQQKEQEIKNYLIHLSGQSNTMGSGIKLSLITRKGMINYSQIQELKNIDLNQYRKQTTQYFKIGIS